MNRTYLAAAAALLIVTACRGTTAPDEADRLALQEEDAGGSAIELPTRVGPAPDFATLAAAESNGDVTCAATLPPGVYDNITVPPGALCIVTFSLVRGNVKALENAMLLVAESQVLGSIVGDKADVMQLRRNLVGGNIEIAEGGPHPSLLEVGLCGNDLPNGNIKVIKMQGGVGISPFAFCVPATPNTVRRGNLQIEDNIFETLQKRLFVSQNEVGQNLQVYKNRGFREKLVFNNVAGESVQCFDNDPPFVGGPNTAPKREGQCF